MILSLNSIAFSLTDEEIREAYKNSFIYEKIEVYDNAIKSLMPVLREYPNTYTVNLRMGWLHYLNRHYADSIKFYKIAMKISPLSMEAKLGILYPLLAQHNYADVESYCYQIINADYYNYYGNLRLVYALRMEEKFDLAEKVAVKMLIVYPIDTKYLLELALIKLGQGDEDYAYQLFNDILILDPENVTANNYFLNQNNKP